MRFAIGTYDHSQALVIDPTLSYSTYLGGSNGQAGDIAYGVAVDTAGEAYITGQASSTDFPATSAFQDALGSGSVENAFVSKFSADGSSLIFLDLFGWFRFRSVALRSLWMDQANAYVAGTAGSTDFPLKIPLSGQGTHIGGDCAFVSSFSSAGALSFSTFLCGGNTDDSLYRISSGFQQECIYCLEIPLQQISRL